MVPRRFVEESHWYSPNLNNPKFKLTYHVYTPRTGKDVVDVTIGVGAGKTIKMSATGLVDGVWFRFHVLYGILSKKMLLRWEISVMTR